MSTVVIGGIKLTDLNKKVNGLKLYQLVNDHVDDKVTDITVPKGFITNGASVPKFLRDHLSPTGEMFRAAVVHDYLYYSKKVSRWRADAIFRDIVLDDTESYLEATLSWLALRIFGGKAWGQDNFKQPQGALRE